MTQADLLILAGKIEREEPLCVMERVYLCHDLRVQGGDPQAIDIQKRMDARTQQWLDSLCDETTATLN